MGRRARADISKHRDFVSRCSSSDILWFSRYLSTGCGSDSTPCYLGKSIIDDWWYPACIKHDLFYFCGFQSDEQRKRVDKIFLRDILKLTPWNFFGCWSAYLVVRAYDAWERVAEPRGYAELRWLMWYRTKYIAERYEQTGFFIEPGTRHLMETLRQRERNQNFDVR